MATDQDGTVPPRGWEIPRGSESEQTDSDSLTQLVEQLLALVPDELRVRVTEALRQLLEALRALIDWCVARLEHGAGGGEVEVRDIPIL
ncbi:MAG TPA: hypothetical protein VHV75_04555 [Solirubrobacteraceae bacterium]|nr:hypothetical protein [Solirubrobacteraceae bacterium]